MDEFKINYIGSTQNQKKYTKYLAYVHPNVNQIAKKHDLDYDKLYRFWGKSKVLTIFYKIFIDIYRLFIYAFFYYLFNMKNFFKFLIEVLLISPLMTIIVLLWTPIYIKRHLIKNETTGIAKAKEYLEQKEND